MNLFFYIVLFALIIDFALESVANILNLKALRLEMPPRLRDVYKPEEYRRSQEYARTATRFHFVTSTFNLVILLAFWFSGGFNYLDVVVRGWGFNPIINGLIYIGILLLAYSLLTLPFSIYATFVIEQRFGFNRTTPRTFITDRLKGLALSVLLGGPLLAGVLALFQYAGNFAWLYCWIAVTLVSLVIEYVAPTWIMPLFNKFTTMPAGPLREAILEYAISVKFPVKNLFVMDGSKRSTRSNAFFTGFGRNKRIALFDTLIEKHPTPELVAVLAHEIGHYKKKHILIGTLIGIAHTGVLFFLLSIFLHSQGLYQAFYMEQPSVYAGLLFFGLLYTPIELVLSIIMQAVSRRNEYAADRFAAETYQPQGLVEALKKLSTHNLSNLTPHPFYVFLNYSHPPLLQRIEAVRRYEKLKTESSPLSQSA
ncbi:MAG: M48 family metallopeptidase [Dehalococcoidales bacterium]|nr:M48 family metallopeptidase [Dehalococcoidales bacterium]